MNSTTVYNKRCQVYLGLVLSQPVCLKWYFFPFLYVSFLLLCFSK